MDWLRSQFGDHLFEFIRKSAEHAEASTQQVLILENQTEIEDAILDLLFSDSKNLLTVETIFDIVQEDHDVYLSAVQTILDTLVADGRIVKKSNLYSSGNIDPDIYWSLKSTEFTFGYGIILYILKSGPRTYDEIVQTYKDESKKPSKTFRKLQDSNYQETLDTMIKMQVIRLVDDRYEIAEDVCLF